MNVTQEQLHKEIIGVEDRLTKEISRVESNLTEDIENLGSDIHSLQSSVADFKVEMNLRFTEQDERWDQKLSDWVSLLRVDIENQRIIFVNELQKQMQLQRFWFQEDTKRIVEESLATQRKEFNTEVTRHMTSLGEEYQWRLAAVGEKVDLTWEKCERKYVELERQDMTIAEKVTALEAYLPDYSSMKKQKRKGKSLQNKKDSKK